MNPAFFLSLEDRCLPELTEAAIDAEAAEQRVKIEEELLKLRLKRRCFVALAQLSAQSVVAGLKEESAADHPDTSGLHLFSPGGSSEPLQSGPHPANTNCLSVPQLNKTNPEHRPAGLSAEDHNRFPKGRW